MARVLAVCTANVCRSPVMEALLARGLLGAATVGSAGTGTTPGWARCRRAQEWLDGAGAVPARGVSRALDADLVRGADLILTATRAHRAEVVRLVPRAQQIAFTLRQAARLAEWRMGVDPAENRMPRAARGRHAASPAQDPVSWLVEQLEAARGLAPRPVSPDEDDIPDPHEDEASHELALGLVEESTKALLGLVGGVAVGRVVDLGRGVSVAVR